MSQAATNKGKTPTVPSNPAAREGNTPAGSSKPSGKNSLYADAAIVTGDICGPYIGGKKLGLRTDITVTLVISMIPDMDPWVGLRLEFPLGADNEDLGFGVRYRSAGQSREKARVELAPDHVINVWAIFFFGVGVD